MNMNCLTFYFVESTWLKIDGSLENIWILIDALDEANDEYDNKIAANTCQTHQSYAPLDSFYYNE